MGLKVNKIENTLEYGVIYDLGLPIRFYFKKDGSFDGIEIFSQHASKRDHKLIDELLQKLGEAIGINHTYLVEAHKEEPNSVIYEDNVIRVKASHRPSNDGDKITIKYKGQDLQLIGFAEVINKENGKTEFLMKQKNGKRILIYPLAHSTILKSFLWYLIEGHLGYEIVDMRDIIDYHDKLEKKFGKHDKSDGR